MVSAVSVYCENFQAFATSSFGSMQIRRGEGLGDLVVLWGIKWVKLICLGGDSPPPPPPPLPCTVEISRPSPLLGLVVCQYGEEKDWEILSSSGRQRVVT